MSAFGSETIKVIDTDTHVVEPYDLWTSRVSTARWGDLVPHVIFDPARKEDVWVSGGKVIGTGAAAAAAGWMEAPPARPSSLDLVDPRLWQSEGRLQLMDEYGIYASVLYPNVGLFGSGSFATMEDAELALLLVQAYNDYQSDFASAAPDRLIPISLIPFWDIDLSIAEMARCKSNGHRGFIFSQQPEYFGAPTLSDPSWDKLWAAAQEMQLPVNFHIASGDITETNTMGKGLLHPSCGRAASFAVGPSATFLSNAKTIAILIGAGICHRFPDLNFVSVESGVGWMPFLLEGLDWGWAGCSVRSEHPEYDLLPSEYFKRQIYGCFWFEHGDHLEATIRELGADNILYETDFPHPVSMAPGPASHAMAAKDFIDQKLSGLGAGTLRKILHDNAARLYHLK